MDKTLLTLRAPAFLRATRQRGVTLIISVVLLLLLSVIVLLATNVGLQEQRTSGNDLRAKLTHHAAEAALNYTGEFFKQNVGVLRPTPPAPVLWQPCPANSTTFPCGVLLDQAGNPETGTMRFTGNINIPAGVFTAACDLAANANCNMDVGAFTATVEVGVVMCRVPQGVSPPACTAAAGAPGSSVLSMVARAQIAGEASSTTLVQSITSFSKLNSATNTPPLASAGIVDVTGALDIVTNPNAAGTGVPVSVWTRKDVKKVGSPNTCYLDEFVRFGAKGSATPAFCDQNNGGCSAPNPDIILCDDCRCPTDENALSFSKAGITCGEGIDILDVDPVTEECGPNKDVRPDEFPCDLFEFMFGVKARADLLPVPDPNPGDTCTGDCFCETLITVADPDNPSGPSIGADEQFLRDNANIIVPTAANFDANNPRHRTCAQLGSTTRGLVWIQEGVDCPLSEVGSAEHPVVLVEDRDATYNRDFRLFGILFVRALDPVLDPAVGGDATLRFNGNAAIYGSAVVQGVIVKATGTGVVINNQTILQNLVNAPELQAFGTMPGSWTDRFSY